MKFVPSKLEKTADNSRGKESWKDKLKNLTSVIGVLLVLYFVIGLLADFVAMRISEDTEGKVFGSAFSVLQSESAPPEFGQAEEIFDRLIRNSELRPLPYSLVYWDENTPNAFAAPGGGVIVTQGLLDTVHRMDPGPMAGAPTKALNPNASVFVPGAARHDSLLGQRVRISGLSARPELNGRVGEARAFNAEKGRWAVLLPSRESHREGAYAPAQASCAPSWRS